MLVMFMCSCFFHLRRAISIGIEPRFSKISYGTVMFPFISRITVFKYLSLH